MKKMILYALVFISFPALHAMQDEEKKYEDGKKPISAMQSVLLRLTALANTMEERLNTFEQIMGRTDARLSRLEENVVGLGRQNGVLVEIVSKEFPLLSKKLAEMTREMKASPHPTPSHPLVVQRGISLRELLNASREASPRSPQVKPRIAKTASTLSASSTPSASPRTEATLMPEIRETPRDTSDTSSMSSARTQVGDEDLHSVTYSSSSEDSDPDGN